MENPCNKGRMDKAKPPCEPLDKCVVDDCTAKPRCMMNPATKQEFEKKGAEAAASLGFQELRKIIPASEGGSCEKETMDECMFESLPDTCAIKPILKCMGKTEKTHC